MACESCRGAAAARELFCRHVGDLMMATAPPLWDALLVPSSVRCRCGEVVAAPADADAICRSMLEARRGPSADLAGQFARERAGSRFVVHSFSEEAGWRNGFVQPQTVELDELVGIGGARQRRARVRMTFSAPRLRVCDADSMFTPLEVADMMRVALNVDVAFENRPEPPFPVETYAAYFRARMDAEMARAFATPIGPRVDAADSAAEIAAAAEDFESRWRRWGLAPAPRWISPAQRQAAEARSVELLRDWLDSGQLADFDATRSFEVVGGCSGRRYRVRWGFAMNVDEEDGARICFAPVGAGHEIPVGDVMLAQKIALETDEPEALRVANRMAPYRAPPPADDLSEWRVGDRVLLARLATPRPTGPHYLLPASLLGTLGTVTTIAPNDGLVSVAFDAGGEYWVGANEVVAPLAPPTMEGITAALNVDARGNLTVEDGRGNRIDIGGGTLVVNAELTAPTQNPAPQARNRHRRAARRREAT